MDERIRAAFDQIEADPGLKERTRSFVAERTRGYRRSPAPAYTKQLAAAACLVLTLAGGWWLWMVPAAEISIDVNPSIELAVNRMDRVIAVEGRNDDGRQLAGTLDLRFTGYTQAVEAVLDSPQLAPLVERGEPVTITVVGSDQQRQARMLSQVESCTAGRQNTYCCAAHPREVSAAHGEGLSCGKYKLFLELQRLDPGITVEEVQGMTMGELLERIQSLSPPGEEEAWTRGGQGHGHHHQHGRR